MNRNPEKTNMRNDRHRANLAPLFAATAMAIGLSLSAFAASAKTIYIAVPASATKPATRLTCTITVTATKFIGARMTNSGSTIQCNISSGYPGSGSSNPVYVNVGGASMELLKNSGRYAAGYTVSGRLADNIVNYTLEGRPQTCLQGITYTYSSTFKGTISVYVPYSGKSVASPEISASGPDVKYKAATSMCNP